ncbi:MAG: hypothetical protein KDK39_13290 [Leptospiraceae bacterium]|nr:hypothetical protein [Leptospiraceae bacterium]
MNRLETALQDLRVLLIEPELATGRVFAWSDASTSQMFFRLHIPLLVSFPLAMLFSPFSWWHGWSSMKYVLVLSMIMLLGPLIIALVHDLLLRYMQIPRTDLLEPYQPGNSSLYALVPLMSTGVFYFFHPALGLVVQLIAVVYSFLLTIRLSSSIYQYSRARVLANLVQSIMVLFIPLFGALILLAFARTWLFFR